MWTTVLSFVWLFGHVFLINMTFVSFLGPVFLINWVNSFLLYELQERPALFERLLEKKNVTSVGNIFVVSVVLH